MYLEVEHHGSVEGGSPVPAESGSGDGSAHQSGCAFSGSDKKDLVAEAVQVYLEQRREDLRAGMVEALQVLDGSLKSDVMLLTGLTAEEIDAVGGIDE